MVGPTVDCLRNPLGAVRGLFAKACAANGGDQSVELSRCDWGVKELFEKCLFEAGAYSQVPQINTVPLDSIPANSLVRFHGMVQDMFDVEYYAGAYKDGGVWHTNKYTDKFMSQDIEQLNPEIWDRRLIYCIPVPGENQWVKDTCFSHLPTNPEVVAGQSLKRQRESFPSEDENMDCDLSSENGSDKRLRTSNALDNNEPGNLNSGLNSLGECKPISCVIKMYDGTDADLKLNDIAEFFGVLAFDPVIPAAQSNCNSSSDLVSLSGSFMEEDIASQLPTSKVPRLHCIALKKISTYNIPRQLSHANFSDTASDIIRIRESLILQLKTVLGEDRLAAEYLLLHLISKVHSRVEPVAIGKLSLNITGCQAGSEGSLSAFSVAVGQTISMLLPCSHVLALSLGTLNTSLFAPRKDYTTNRLVTGALQLAAGTHLTLDETALNTGRLNDTGVKNLQSLKDLLETQKVEYDFQYYKMEMPTDLPVLVLSCGKSRLLPADALVPLRCTSDLVQMHAEESDLMEWRMYLSNVREAEHVIEPPMQKIVEDDLVAARQRDRTIGPDTFHRWLTMARLLSLSFGERSLTMERWEMVKDLETSCAARLRV